MGKLTPNSTLKLYSGTFWSEKNNLRPVWSSAQAREAYFARHCVYTKTVQIVKKRKDTVQVSLRDISGARLEECKYLSFQNPHFDNKIYYARIIEKDYINDSTAYVSFKINWWLTDMFDMAYTDMSIEREHMSQSDAVTAQTNPYTGDILEMRTQEPGLAVSTDLQKRIYKIGGQGDTDTDGLYMMQSLYGNTGQDMTTYIMYLSPVDWDHIAEEGVTPSPQDWFMSLLSTLATSAYCFYVGINDDSVHSIHPSYQNKKWGNKLPNPYYVLGWSSRKTAGNYEMKDLIDKLTSWNVVSSILAIYGIPENHMRFFMYSGTSIQTASPSKVLYTSTGLSDIGNKSPKLACYPFAYLTVESPTGDIKEYQYEKFASVREGNAEGFYLIGDLAEKPQIALVPEDYCIEYASGVVNPYGNFNEALMFDQYPTVAYVTDAWLAQIAAVSASAIAGNTMSAQYQRKIEMEGTIANGVSQVADVFGSLGSGSTAENPISAVSLGASQGLDMASSGGRFAQTLTSYEAEKYQVEQIKHAYSAIVGDYEGTALYENMKKTRPAYVAHEYHKSNGDGTILMNTAVNSDFMLKRVRLDDVIMDQYDKYFKRFGYASGRIGKPRVFNYLSGSSDTTKLPDWQDAGNYKFTYVKTADAKIMCEDLEAESEIAAILNNGTRFIKGDEMQ